jgi:hypothetical protein
VKKSRITLIGREEKVYLFSQNNKNDKFIGKIETVKYKLSPSKNMKKS